MGRPYVSSIIVNYNYGRFLGQAIESLLEQDFPEAERELIVVDDGSSDDSIEVAASFRDKVRLIRQTNKGQAGAFAAGYAAARGEIFCLLDADDYCEPGKLSALAERLSEPGVGLAQHYLRDVDAEGRPLPNPLPRWPRAYSIDDFLDGRCEDAATSGLAFKRSVLEKVLPVPEAIFCWYDEYLIARCLFHAALANIPRVLGYHRIHGANHWAHRLSDPAKMRAYVEQGRLFLASLEPELASAGKSLSPRFRELAETDFLRSEILAAASGGCRSAAWRLWRRLPGSSAHALFRRAALLLGVASPSLYLALYRLYARRPRG
ncbi:MAG: glycosyltransferase [Elusimicrobia bacterium]|nr:glycosyltransferase [Elusimicrobiota bacterium]MDE2236723.1 glycosyltransferase [Elusimicrobiota bacterium]MDE2424342.1 glycosyltransferase [Elusimicrobiota bacterium]